MRRINQVVDFHSHILPGIDDGSKDVATSLAMLNAMAEQGIDICIATPHFYGYRCGTEEFFARRNEAWEQLQKELPGGMPEIYLGAEVALYSELPDLTDEELDALCVENTRILLLEMPFAQWTGYDVELVAQLSIQRGYTVVLAHLDRFLDLQKDDGALENLLQMPLYVQINARSLLTWGDRRKSLKLFREEKAHLLGSDCHDLKDRKPNLQEARKVLEKKLGGDILRQIDELGNDLLAQTIGRCVG